MVGRAPEEAADAAVDGVRHAGSRGRRGRRRRWRPRRSSRTPRGPTRRGGAGSARTAAVDRRLTRSSRPGPLSSRGGRRGQRRGAADLDDDVVVGQRVVAAQHPVGQGRRHAEGLEAAERSPPGPPRRCSRAAARTRGGRGPRPRRSWDGRSGVPSVEWSVRVMPRPSQKSSEPVGVRDGELQVQQVTAAAWSTPRSPWTIVISLATVYLVCRRSTLCTVGPWRQYPWRKGMGRPRHDAVRSDHAVPRPRGRPRIREDDEILDAALRAFAVPGLRRHVAPVAQRRARAEPRHDQPAVRHQGTALLRRHRPRVRHLLRGHRPSTRRGPRPGRRVGRHRRPRRPAGHHPRRSWAPPCCGRSSGG